MPTANTNFVSIHLWILQANAVNVDIFKPFRELPSILIYGKPEQGAFPLIALSSMPSRNVTLAWRAEAVQNRP